MSKQENKTIIHSHATTWHDGAVAMLLSNGQIVDLAAERVGDRFKHSWNSRLAYDHLKNYFDASDVVFGSPDDHFVNQSNGLEDDNHHLYHAASAFYASTFKDAAVVIVDGQGPDFGKRASTSLWKGSNDSLSLIEAPYLADGIFAPQSIGHFYTAIGALSGMQELHEEGKTIGLAPYGEPSKYLEFFKKFAYSNPDGSYYIDPNFILAIFGNTFGPTQFGWQPQPPEIQEIWDEFMQLRGHSLKKKSEDVSKDDMDTAYAGQDILEEIMLGLTRRAKLLTGSDHLCLAGGVALNSVVNGKILKSGIFEDIYVFPASGDDGQAIGKLMVDIKNRGLDVDTQMDTAYLGPVYSKEKVLEALSRNEDQIVAIPFAEVNLYREVAKRIAGGEVIGWYNGGSEIGPRALGHRSILADPRDPNMRDYINFEVKHREWYRPFAPVILEQLASEYFDLNVPSPFMLIVADVLTDKQDIIPAVTHIDGTARIQTIREDQDERYYNVVEAFYKRTGVPVLLNTSFNGAGEPIVETPDDAIRSFLSMNLDALVIDDFLILKKEKLPNNTMVNIVIDETTADRPKNRQLYILEIRSGKHLLSFAGKLTGKEESFSFVGKQKGNDGPLGFTPFGQLRGVLPRELLDGPIPFDTLSETVQQDLRKWFGVMVGAYADKNFERLYAMFPDMLE
ncbi:MAG: carbamoyltransferase C-terminal domain-containing protein [Patescibacteria group bacterium]